MPHPLNFDTLTGLLHRQIDVLPEHRKAGPKTRYTLKDAALGAFGAFYMQSPSFLDYQRHLQHTKGRNNASTLFRVAQIPCNNQIRNLLDPLPPSHLDGVYLEVVDGLEAHGLLRDFRVLNHQLFVALDGTNYHASDTIHCQNCLRRHTSKGHTR